MDAWESLGSPIVQGAVLEWPLPLAGRGGTLWLRFPAVAEPEIVSLGIADDSFSPPARLHFKALELQTHAQVMSVDIPPLIEAPFLGVRFAEDSQPLDVFYFFQMTAILPDLKEQIPSLDGSQLEAPVDADYNKFVLIPWGETFSAFSDSEWLGPLQRDEYTFSTEKEQGDLAALDPAQMSTVIEFQPSNHQEYIGSVAVQNFNDTDFTGRIFVSGDDGVVYDQVTTIPANGRKGVGSSLRASNVGSLVVKVASASSTKLALNVASQHLVTVAPEGV